MRRRSYASEGSHEPASARRGHQAPRERTHESNVRSGVAIPCSAHTAQPKPRSHFTYSTERRTYGKVQDDHGGHKRLLAGHLERVVQVMTSTGGMGLPRPPFFAL